MKSLTVDLHSHDPATDEDLYALLKEAEGPGTSPGDETSTKGTTPETDPVPREAGSIDATQGEKDGTGPEGAVHFSDSATSAFRRGREEFLAKHFGGIASSKGADQKLLGQHLDHYKSGDFGASKPMVKEKSKIQKTAGIKTLRERVLEVTGLR